MKLTIFSITLCILLISSSAFATICDVDVDGDVDRIDIGLISTARNSPADSSFDPRDADEDSIITVLDARQCVGYCTLSNCQVPEPNIEVPNLFNLPENEVINQLISLGLLLEKNLAYSNSITAGNVISQSPSAGTLVAAGSTVTVTVSDGPSSTTVGQPISGPPNALALDNLTALTSPPLSPSDISDGMILSRLFAVISRDATVSGVNDELARISGGIIAMSPTSPMIVIGFTGPQQKADLIDIIEKINNSPHFIIADFATIPEATIVPENWIAPNTDEFDHLEMINSPPTWNLKDFIFNNSAEYVNVIIADQFRNTIPNGLSPITLTGRLTPVNVPLNNVSSWHGISVASHINSIFDDQKTTSVHPAPSKGMNVTALGVFSDWITAFDLIDNQIKSYNNGNVVLNTSLQFKKINGGHISPLTKVMLAMEWRTRSSSNSIPFIHVTAAGNYGSELSSTWASPFTVSSVADDLCTLLTSKNASLCRDIAEAYQRRGIDVAKKSENVIIVGSISNSGFISDISQVPADVYAVGENVASLDIDGSVKNRTGTSFSTPQISSLISLLWNINPHLNFNEILKIINNSSQANPPGIINSYDAVLSMDESIKDKDEAPVRYAVLDVVSMNWVTGQNESPDGSFTNADLRKWIDQFKSSTGLLEYSRFDINGDGFTGDSGISGTFDLNANGQSNDLINHTIEGVSVLFDESALTENQIFCFYAYSDLYEGDDFERTVVMLPLLEDCGVKIDSVSVDVHFGSSTGWNLPTPIAQPISLENMGTPFIWNGFWRGTGNCFSEQGSPLWSSRVETGAYFIPFGLARYHPAPVGGNRMACSNFLAVKDGRIWLNAGVRRYQFSGGFSSEREYQLRYFSDPDYGNTTSAKTGRAGKDISEAQTGETSGGSFWAQQIIISPSVSMKFNFIAGS